MKNQAFLRRFGFAIQGLSSAFQSESSFKTEVAAAVGVVIALAAWLQPGPLWWGVVACAVVLVLAAELMNTAIELLADHLHPEQHPQIKLVKDCAAAAVLVACAGAVAVAVALLVDVLGS